MSLASCAGDVPASPDAVEAGPPLKQLLFDKFLCGLTRQEADPGYDLRASMPSMATMYVSCPRRVNVNELRLGFSNTTRNPEGILSHNSRKCMHGPSKQRATVFLLAAFWVTLVAFEKPNSKYI